MSDTETPEPANLRFLRRLVTVLTMVMIAGVIAIVALLVTRLSGAAVAVPEALAVPSGVRLVAVTQAPSYWLATTDDDRLLLFAPDGSFTREIDLAAP